MIDLWKNARIVSGIVWLVVWIWNGEGIGVPAAGEAPGDRVVLENPFLRIEIDAVSGGVVRMLNRQSGSEIMTERPEHRLPFIVDSYSANQAVYVRDPFEKQSGGFSLFKKEGAGSGAKGDLSHVRKPIPGGVRVRQERTTAGTQAICECQLPGGIAVTWSVLVRTNSPLTEWRCRIRNGGGETPANDQRVYRVAFPVLERLRVGERHQSNYLARPYGQGELVPDPSRYEFTRPKYSNVPINVLTYLGWASMPWQDLYAAGKGGIYMASYDLSFQQVDLETWPDQATDSITMDFRTLAFAEPGQSVELQPFEVAIHDGDWHWGAGRYRSWARANHRRYTGPSWVRDECDGWLGTGVPTRRYNDYLSMFEDARWLGLDYLQIWSEMLENVGTNKTRKAYYCFLWPDPERGGEEELSKAVHSIRERGGHIGFYHNIWTWDSELAKGMEQWRDELPADVHVPKWWGESRRWASVFPDGTRQAGNFVNGYAGMCPAARGYQDYVMNWVVDRYVKRDGVDAWYFDSMPVTMFGASRICFSAEHGPSQPHGVGRGMLEMLDRVHQAARPTVNLAVTSETVSDALMQYNSHALGLELIEGITRYPHPEIYAFTFPEHAIFSGTCNGAGSGLKYYYPDLDQARREDTMNRVFLMGYRFDILMGKINRSDPFALYLRALIGLRQKVKGDLYGSDFRDEIGMSGVPERVYAKLFRARNGRSLTIQLVDRRSRERKEGFPLKIDVEQNDFRGAMSGRLHQFDGSAEELKILANAEGKVTVEVPALKGEAAALVLERRRVE